MKSKVLVTKKLTLPSRISRPFLSREGGNEICFVSRVIRTSLKAFWSERLMAQADCWWLLRTPTRQSQLVESLKIKQSLYNKQTLSKTHSNSLRFFLQFLQIHNAFILIQEKTKQDEKGGPTSNQYISGNFSQYPNPVNEKFQYLKQVHWN